MRDDTATDSGTSKHLAETIFSQIQSSELSAAIDEMNQAGKKGLDVNEAADLLVDAVMHHSEDNATLCRAITVLTMTGHETQAARIAGAHDTIEAIAGNVLFYAQNIHKFQNADLYAVNKRIFMAALNGIGISNNKDYYESGEQNFLESYLKDRTQPVLFDIGAGEGAYAAEMKRVSPDSVVYAFEPDSQSYAALNGNATAQQYSAFNAGMSDKEENRALYSWIDEQGEARASVYRAAVKNGEAEPEQTAITCTTVDAFVEKNSISVIDLVAISAGGHELKVLQGAKKTLKQGLIGAVQIRFGELNILSRTFFQDFQSLMPDFRWFRLLPDGMAPLDCEPAVVRELFAFQTLVALKR